MVVKARSALAEILRKTSVAGREHKNLVSLLNCTFDVITALVRSDILRTVVLFLQDIRKPAPVARAYPDVAVALVVLEQNVVLRRMLFDKTALENQCLKFAVGDDIFKIVNIVNHSAHLFGVIVLRAEVLADTVFESLCLADIYNFSAFIVHNINAGQKRQSHCFFAQFLHFRIHNSPNFKNKKGG